MELITQRDLIRSLIRTAKGTEPRYRSEEREFLAFLDPETATAEAVTEIENSDYWVTRQCNECGRRVKDCVEIGEEFEDCEQCSIAVCRDCLKKALDLIDTKGSNNDVHGIEVIVCEMPENTMGIVSGKNVALFDLDGNLLSKAEKK